MTKEPTHDHEKHLKNDGLNSFSIERRIEFDDPTKQNKIKEFVLDLVNEIKEQVKANTDVIGHIKGRVEMEESLRFNLTNIDSEPEFNSKIDPSKNTKGVYLRLLSVNPLPQEKLVEIKDKAESKINQKF